MCLFKVKHSCFINYYSKWCKEKGVCSITCWPDCMTLPFDHTHDFFLSWSFKVNVWNSLTSWMTGLIDMVPAKWLWVVHSWPWHWHLCAHTGVGGCTGLWPGDFRRRRAIYIPSLVYKTVVDLPIKYSCDPHRTRICTKLVKIYICTRLAGILLCSWGVVSHHKYSRL